LKVTRIDILTRGLTNRCPNCGGKTLFVPGKLYQMHAACPACGFKFEGAGGNEGFYLRSTSLNFGMTLVGYLLPVVLLAYTRTITLATVKVLAFGGVLIPFLLYRPSRSWSLLHYYIFAPEELPANGGESRK
jgi:uncharacterized protein (DUF983 family)